MRMFYGGPERLKTHIPTQEAYSQRNTLTWTGWRKTYANGVRRRTWRP